MTKLNQFPRRFLHFSILFMTLSLVQMVGCNDDLPAPNTIITLDSLNNPLLRSVDAYATILVMDTLDEVGFCWNKTGEPSVSDSTIRFKKLKIDKLDTDLTPMQANQTYYVKAFAKVKGVYAYSSQKSIKTWDGSLVDVMGYSYKTTQIGRQGWMAENLRTTKYADGTPVYVSSTLSNRTYWYGSGHRYIVNFDTDINNDKAVNELDSLIFAQKYGLLYSWFSANNVYDHRQNPGLYGKKVSATSRDICPKGWHIPSSQEVDQLKTYVSLKHGFDSITVYLTSKTGWLNNLNGNDLYGLNLQPSALWQEPSSTHSNILGKTVYLWNKDEVNDVNADYWYADNLSKRFLSGGVGKGIHGFCVRCLKDK
jgi:uncharacterized protein (TIGR02145 family)